MNDAKQLKRQQKAELHRCFYVQCFFVYCATYFEFQELEESEDEV